MNFKYHASVIEEKTAIRVDRNHLYIVDEADYAILDKEYTFSGSGHVLCLTATASKNTEGLENAAYALQKYVRVDSNIYDDILVDNVLPI